MSRVNTIISPLDKNPEVAEPKVWGDLRQENLEDAVESLSRSIWGILQASGACAVDLGNGIGGDDGHQHADVVWIFRWSRASINSQWAGEAPVPLLQV
eukprot:symbB.v1.2.012864.t1/scaffold875.1/size155714/13